jgi:small subunit ribosomal protein S6
MKIAGYETNFTTRNELADDGLKTLQEKLNAAIAGFDGEIVLHEDWGNRKLAYPIQKETRGRYSHFVYTGKGDVVAEVERNLRLNEFVMRFLTVNIDKEFEKEAFLKRRTELKAAAKVREDEKRARKEAAFQERNRERNRNYDAPAHQSKEDTE